MSKPRLLDLFCGAGGATRGYQLAGFHVTGVDINPQPHYVGDDFIRADVMDPLFGDTIALYDAVHASPPCQAYSTMRRGLWKDREHPDLIAPVRELLRASGLPYVIENVENARRLLIEPVKLCGTMFGLGTSNGAQLRRHRYFECSFGFFMTPPCQHNSFAPVPVYGGGQNGDYHQPRRAPKRVPATIGVWGHAGGSSDRDGLVQFNTAARREAMGIHWMTGDELSESIPPAYTEFIGVQLLRSINAERKGQAPNALPSSELREERGESRPVPRSLGQVS